MIAVSSMDDPRLADYRDLVAPERLRARGLFVAEGRLVVRRLLAAPRFRAASVLVSPAAADRLRDVLEPAGVPVYVLDQASLNGLVGFNIHRGCLALAERPRPLGLPDLALDTARLLVVLEGVNNPDNVGGIFRSAAAFGADAVVLGPDCGDPLYRKAVRTSMGAALMVPFAEAGPWPAALAALRGRGFRVAALSPEPGATPLHEAPAGGRVAVLIGAEGTGLTDAARAAADQVVRIAMTDRVDSLNAGVAAAVALHHFAVPFLGPG